MRIPSVPTALLAVLLLSCAGHRAAPEAGGGDPVPALQLPPDVRPLRYVLELEVVPARAEGIRGSAAIDVALDRPRSVLWLNGRGLRVSAVSLEAGGRAAEPARWTQVTATGVARVDLARPVGPGRATLRIRWEAPWTEIAGAFHTRVGDDWYAGTQLEAVDARAVFPGFDEPRFKTPFEVTLVVPDGLVAVSNAPERDASAAGAGLRRVRFAPTAPLPTYLVFAAAGPYDVVGGEVPPNEVRARPLPVRLLAPRGRAGELAFARQATPALVAELERYFGIPFPYEKLDQVVLPGLPGAMENAGAISYAEGALLFDPQRRPADARRNIAVVMAHEMAHQWFGDLVTPAWWTDIWLNESFADWMGYRAASRWQPGWGLDADFVASAADAFRWDEQASARAIRKPLERIEDVDQQFDSMSYQKGGALIAMFERYVGEDRFRAAIHRYLAAHAHGSGSTPDLLAEISRQAGRDLAPALDGFLSRPGSPLVSVRVACDAAGARLLLSQRRYLPRGGSADPAGTWEFPVCARYAAAGAERERCTMLSTAEGVLPLPEGCPAWVFPQAGGAGYYRFSLAAPDLARLPAAGLARLSDTERIAYARAVTGAERAGVRAYGDAMDALLAVAGDPSPDVGGAVREALFRARDRIVPPRARGAVEVLARRVYRPALDRVGWEGPSAEHPAATRLRGDLVTFLALTARDPHVRAEAARRGRRYAGVDDGVLHLEAAAPEVAGTALAVAVEDGGAPVFDAVAARLAAARDEALRIRLASALAASPDPALSRRWFALLRSGALTPSERLRSLRAWHDTATAERNLRALEADPAARKIWMPWISSGGVAFLFAGLCDEAAERRVRAFLEPLLGESPELRIPLAQVLESIHLCAVERAADADAAAAWFERRARR